MNVYIREGGRRAVAALIAEKVGPEVRVIHDAEGAPALVGSPLHISISHSRRFAAIALDGETRIGIDIEEPRIEQLRRVISKFLTEREMPQWGERLLAAWTAKEAVFKAAGVPTIGLASIDLTTPGEARIPDGRRFRIQITETAEFTISTATPLI